MFTLKLYKNGPLPPHGRTVIMQTMGIWIDYIGNGIKRIMAFEKKVGVGSDYDEFYVGGIPTEEHSVIQTGDGGNHFTWGVLENAMGKTTEML